MNAAAETRLTLLAHGGGCGCKLAPSVLQQLLAGVPQAGPWANLLVGSETSDDAAVFRLTDDLALVATTDFFMPIVDDPYEFGRIAAANAFSDVYAMGGTPVLALALLGMPVGRIAPEVVQRILAGGAAMCAEAGIPVAGGHSIDNPEPIYGLVALGTVHPDRILRNGGACPGDVLLLTKGLGVGIFSAALKRGRLPDDAYRTMLDSTTRLNVIGPALAAMPEVHAVTDVTGFGLLGHTMEMCRAANMRAVIDMAEVPILPGAAALARDGLATGAGSRNWASYGADVSLEPGITDWHKSLLCDPQTSGGLLIAAAPEAAERIIAHARSAGFAQTAAIGDFQTASAKIVVRTARN